MSTRQTDDAAAWWGDQQRPDAAETEVALQECQEQLAGWGLVMPPGKPVLLDFGLGGFRRNGLIIYSIANEVEAGYCGKLLFVFDGQTCPCHEHGVKHETFFVLKGKVTMQVGGVEKILAGGDTLAMATGVKHSFTGVGNALLLEVSMPSAGGDNRFVDRRIGNEGIV